MYKVKIFGFLEYYRYFFHHFKERAFKLTDSGYPYFFALGYCDKKNQEIVVCRVGKWRERALHELGHVAGYGHVYSQGHIMHPWGFARGMDGLKLISDKLKDDYDHYLEFLR